MRLSPLNSTPLTAGANKGRFIPAGWEAVADTDQHSVLIRNLNTGLFGLLTGAGAVRSVSFSSIASALTDAGIKVEGLSKRWSPPPPWQMSADQYRVALRELGLTQVGAAPILGISARTAQVYAVEGPSGPASLAMRLLVALPLTERDRWLKPPA